MTSARTCYISQDWGAEVRGEKRDGKVEQVDPTLAVQQGSKLRLVQGDISAGSRRYSLSQDEQMVDDVEKMEREKSKPSTPHGHSFQIACTHPASFAESIGFALASRPGSKHPLLSTAK
jgi:hypothetical protein